MLFNGLACFSPSVPASIRKLWELTIPRPKVKNGGKLTHTETDFANAEFLFCDGMEDPWLKPLLSRFSIVRHADWVTLCATEQFIMPIAGYTLDDRFDRSKLVVRDPPADHDARSITSQVTGKRNFDPDHSAEQPFDERPRKRARVADESTTELQAGMDGDASDQVVRSNDHKFSGYVNAATLQKTSLGMSKSVSRHVKKFQKIIQPNDERYSTSSDEIITCTLDPHVLFWDNLFAKSSVGSDCKKLMLKVSDLIQAPNVKAGIFTVDERFLGKMFVTNDRV